MCLSLKKNTAQIRIGIITRWPKWIRWFKCSTKTHFSLEAGHLPPAITARFTQDTDLVRGEGNLGRDHCNSSTPKTIWWERSRMHQLKHNPSSDLWLLEQTEESHRKLMLRELLRWKMGFQRTAGAIISLATNTSTYPTMTESVPAAVLHLTQLLKVGR